MWTVTALQDQGPIIVTLVDKATPQTDYGDVILGSLGLAGVLAVSAVLLGAVVAFVLVQWNRRHRPEDDHMPQIT
jgi:ABC-type spermidine/putrescine transport system permease subunit I